MLITILATVGGVIVVGVGGGLIRPMQQRWESYLSTAEREAPAHQAAGGRDQRHLEQRDPTSEQVDRYHGNGSTSAGHADGARRSY